MTDHTNENATVGAVAWGSSASGTARTIDCTPDFNEVQRFLRALDPGAADWCFRSLTEPRNGDQGRKRNGSLATQRQTLERDAAEGCALFVVVNAGGQTTDAITRIRAVWIDLDGPSLESALAEVRAAVPGLEPSIIVSSSPGKWHVYWCIDPDDPLPIAEFTPIQKRLIQLTRADNVHDLPRIMRLPGSWHRKGEPYKVHIVAREHRRYGATLLRQLLEVPAPVLLLPGDAAPVEAAPAPPPAPEWVTAPPVPPPAEWPGPGNLSGRIDWGAKPHDDIADQFNGGGVAAGEAVLHRNGYVYKHHSAVGSHWLWPGSTSGRAGVVVFKDSGRILSHHSRDPLYVAEDQLHRSHSPFAAMAILEHGGDFKRATKAAAREMGIDARQGPAAAVAGAAAPGAGSGSGDASAGSTGSSGEGKPAGEGTPGIEDGVILQCAADVEPEPVHWLWPGWIAERKLHILAGSPSAGKTTLTMALAAVITQGGRWPCGAIAPKGSVLIWSGEDGVGDTLVPRLHGAGADVSKVHILHATRRNGRTLPFHPATDLPLLVSTARRIGDVRMIVIDPLVAMITKDSHKGAETRADLQPLVDFAADIGAAAVGIHHLTKGSVDRDPVERLTGTIAFGALARVVLMAMKHHEGGRLLIRAKCNIGPDGGAWNYEVPVVRIVGDIETTVAEFGDYIEGEARGLMREADGVGEREPDRATAQNTAVDWLRQLLTDGPRPQKDVEQAAKLGGHAWRTIERAKREAGVVSKKTPAGWLWELQPAPEA